MDDKYDIYCQDILPGKLVIEKLYESDKVLAFYHTKPSYQTHIVIVPKEHIVDLTQVNPDDDNLILEIIHVASDLASKLNLNDGVRLITNMGKFQDAPHLHFHLVSGLKLGN